MTAEPRVLLVDDDPAGLAMLGLVLRRGGFTVATAQGGQEALGLLRAQPFDWLVTDARMLPMDGFDLSREAKRLQPGLRIVMMSAVFAEADIAGYPIEKLFSKPVPVEALERWLSAGPGSRGGGAPWTAR